MPRAADVPPGVVLSFSLFLLSFRSTLSRAGTPQCRSVCRLCRSGVFQCLRASPRGYATLSHHVDLTFPPAMLISCLDHKRGRARDGADHVTLGRRSHFEMMRQRWALDKMGVVGKEVHFAKNPNKVVSWRLRQTSKFQSAFGIDVFIVACRHAYNPPPSSASVPGFLRLAWRSVVYNLQPRRRQRTFVSPQVEKKKKKKKKAMNACMCLATLTPRRYLVRFVVQLRSRLLGVQEGGVRGCHSVSRTLKL